MPILVIILNLLGFLEGFKKGRDHHEKCRKFGFHLMWFSFYNLFLPSFSACFVKTLNRELFIKFSRKVSHKFFTSANIIIRDNPAKIFHEQQFSWKEVKSLWFGFFVCLLERSSFLDSVAFYTLCDDDFTSLILCPSSQHSLPVPNISE